MKHPNSRHVILFLLVLAIGMTCLTGCGLRPQSTKPTSPTNPAPTNPTTPTNPTDPANPNDPVDPTDPIAPTDPIGETQNITFVGRAEYVVSSKNPKIEVRNSEKNEKLGVQFVFTVIDVKTNTVVAKTQNVSPGQYAYIDMMNYYTSPGSYNIIISIRVTDANGNEYNGMNQEAILNVVT